MNITYIMPAFNSAKFVGRAVSSIYTGNFSDGDEVVICDDGSSDDTVSVVQGLQLTHPNLKLLRHAVNRGGGAARNTAVCAAQNPLIFCLDSDNILPSGSVNILKKILVRENADMAAFAHVHFFSSQPESVDKILTYTQSDNPFADYLSKIDVPGGDGNYLYKKSAWRRVGGYPEFAHAMDTWGFGFRMAAENCKSVLSNEGFYYHRFGHGSYWDKCKGLAISKITLQLLIPYLDRIIPKDRSYIFRNYSSWYRNIESRPIRVISSSQQQSSVQLVLRKFLEIIYKRKL